MSHSPWKEVPHVAHQLQHMKPLHQSKNAGVAFLLGFLFGALGLGLYFRSWKDVFVCVGLWMFVFVVLLPTLVGEAFLPFVAPLFCGIYGAWRASSSNAKLT